MKRTLTALLLVLVLLMPLCAQAGDDGWTCESCGQAGNTGNFCSNCGSARPSTDWTCPTCGQEGNTGKYCSNCGTAKPGQSTATAAPTAAPTAEPVKVNDALEQIPGETNKVKVCLSGTDASSYIVNKKDPSRWLPSNATDGDESTCWQFSAKKGLKGKSWIQMTLQSTGTVDEIWFKNGFWAVNDKGKDQYPINARLKGIKVSFCYSGEQSFRDETEFTLKDESRTGWQQFSVGHHENVTQVKVAVVSVYKGSSFPNDVCLSEVMLVEHASSEIAKPAQAEKAATVYESRPDITGCNLLMKLATRSGPGTQYSEPGTFFGKNWQDQTVLVRKKHYDGSIWWVQVDFQNGSKSKYRVWTGVKRVDVDLDKVKEEKENDYIFTCHIHPTDDTWFGPGGKYAKSKIIINRPAVGVVYERENGYVDVKFWYEDERYDDGHRIWLPEHVIHDPAYDNPNIFVEVRNGYGK